MKKLEIFQKLPKFVTQGHEVSKYCWKNGANRFAWGRVATNLHFVKKCNFSKCKQGIYIYMGI